MKTKTFSTAPELYPIRNVVVVDGDTIKGEIVMPLGITKWQIVRLKDWWSPEEAGASINQGRAARNCLERFVQDKNLFLLVLGSRFDRYGRLVASLWHQGGVVLPERVLGAYQLTKDAHKRILDECRGLPKGSRVAQEAQAAVRVAQAQPPREPRNPLPEPEEYFGSW